MARSVDLQKVAEWRARFERFETAGKSVTRFCLGERVSVPSYYQWRRKLAWAGASRSVSPAISRSSSRSAVVEESGAFAPVRLVGAASVTARLRGGTLLEIPLGDLRALALVIETLVRAEAPRTSDTEASREGGAAC